MKAALRIEIWKIWGALALVFAAPGLIFIEEASVAGKKTMEIFVPSSPSGSRDVYARIMAKYMSKYLPDNPTIIVKNIPGAGGDIMLNYMYHRAKKDGYTFATATNAMYRAERLEIKSARYLRRRILCLLASPMRSALPVNWSM